MFPPLQKGGQGGFSAVPPRRKPKIPLNPPFTKGEAFRWNRILPCDFCHRGEALYLSVMAGKKWRFAHIPKQIVFFLLGAVLTGFFTVFFTKFLGHFIGAHFAVALGVGLAVALTLWFSQLARNPPFLLKGTSPLIAGFCAALGVHISRVWLS
jgi:hypothetical protein